MEPGRDQASYNDQGAQSLGEPTQVQLVTDTDQALPAAVVLLGRVDSRQGPRMAMQLHIPIRPPGIDRCAPMMLEQISDIQAKKLGSLATILAPVSQLQRAGER